ncbi:hypothetical protein O3G_MSEX005168 [Manduca sexta]|uniref:Little elongation complex subunit 2 C-terminal domain-containing protein n=1 Tax=Manduca sexta TaxID=7130 RepID=A0A921YZ38_MANSE|nr:hypothetical protein O3G_MSEX005168 [Manduca sexta]
MEHIRLFDWCATEPDRQFVTVEELDNCVTERILRNKFYDPLESSSSEDEGSGCKIDWDSIFAKKKDSEKTQKIFVPGLHAVPPYLKKSSLTEQQHYQCLKVLCQDNPNVLPDYFIARPTKADRRVMEQIKELYEKEQKEYAEWARALWNNCHCIRALRPKPVIETVYDAEYKMRSHEVRSFPKTWHVAAQIPLEMRSGVFEMVLREDVVKVNLSELPQIQCPEVIREKLSIMRPPSIPEPCTKHPCRFILPDEKTVTILPLTEVQCLLAQFALDYGAQYIASESALRCVLDSERVWTLPVSVCETIGADGEKNNIIVLGSEFMIHKEQSKIRTYRAARHLLEYALVPASEKAKIIERNNKSQIDSRETDVNMSILFDSESVSSGEEEDSLVIDPGDYSGEPNEQDYVMSMDEDTCDQDSVVTPVYAKNSPKRKKEESTPVEKEKRQTRSSDAPNFGIYTCSCKDSIFEKPPPRSFRKWLLKKKNSHETYDIIVHCSHKTKNRTQEVVLEPTIEYQADLGASQLSQSRIRAMALALMLREDATLLNVRVDSDSGDIISVEQPSLPPGVEGDVAHIVYACLAQLSGLLPGHYVLLHESRHGANALLLSPRGAAQGGEALSSLAAASDDEARGVRAPPVLEPTLLPYHKYRRILPCAFTPYESQVAKEPKKPVTRQKTPPQAIRLDAGAQSGAHRKWPKRKRKKTKKLIAE